MPDTRDTPDEAFAKALCAICGHHRTFHTSRRCVHHTSAGLAIHVGRAAYCDCPGFQAKKGA